MNACLIVFSAAFLLAIVCGGTALLLARLAIGAARQTTALGQNIQFGMEALSTRFESLEQQTEALRRQPAAASPDAGKAALNLNKRAQVLRMHRRGDPPDRIASLLEVPRQEVDLLIKVHRIIISQL
jgi:outer membrane murein-binding lipoprotein Lpp